MILHCTFCAVRVRVSYKVPAIGRALLCSPGLAYLLSREGGRYLRAGGIQLFVLVCLGRSGTARSREIILFEKEGWLGLD